MGGKKNEGGYFVNADLNGKRRKKCFLLPLEAIKSPTKEKIIEIIGGNKEALVGSNTIEKKRNDNPEAPTGNEDEVRTEEQNKNDHPEGTYINGVLLFTTKLLTDFFSAKLLNFTVLCDKNSSD